MAEGKRSDPKSRGPVSRGGASGRGRSRPARDSVRAGSRAAADSLREGITQPIRRVIVEAAAQQSEERLGLTARRAAILAAVICVLTLTIAGPVRTYFAQRTEMKQLAASESSLRAQIAELESEKAKLADPAYIAAQARERLGFVMPGDIPYQVQLPPGSAPAPAANPQAEIARNTDPWYTSLWHTIADTPHGPPEVAPEPGAGVPDAGGPEPVAPESVSPPPGPSAASAPPPSSPGG